MNFKSWWIGLAVLAAVVISFAGSAWHFARQDVPSTENQKPSGVSEANDTVKADGVYAPPFAAARQDNEVTGVNGRWVGAVDIGRGSKIQFSFNLQQAANGQLTGTATFPIGESNIQDGKVEGNQLSFSTQHRLQSTGQTLVTKFVGNMSNGMIALDMQSEGGISKLTINRISH